MHYLPKQHLPHTCTFLPISFLFKVVWCWIVTNIFFFFHQRQNSGSFEQNILGTCPTETRVRNHNTYWTERKGYSFTPSTMKRCIFLSHDHGQKIQNGSKLISRWVNHDMYKKSIHWLYSILQFKFWMDFLVMGSISIQVVLYCYVYDHNKYCLMFWKSDWNADQVSWTLNQLLFCPSLFHHSKLYLSDKRKGGKWTRISSLFNIYLKNVEINAAFKMKIRESV